MEHQASLYHGVQMQMRCMQAAAALFATSFAGLTFCHLNKYCRSNSQESQPTTPSTYSGLGTEEIEKVKVLLKPARRSDSSDSITSQLVADEECAICYQPLTDQESLALTNTCKHQFHEQCLVKWLRT